MVSESVKQSFESVGFKVNNVVLEHYADAFFGDFVVIVETSRGHFRVTNDRGQAFIDVFDDARGEFIGGEELAPELSQIYEGGQWRLVDLLSAVVRNG